MSDLDERARELLPKPEVYERVTGMGLGDYQLVPMHYSEKQMLDTVKAALSESARPAIDLAPTERRIEGETLHWHGIPVAVRGVATTHPNNWPLIDEAGKEKSDGK